MKKILTLVILALTATLACGQEPRDPKGKLASGNPIANVYKQVTITQGDGHQMIMIAAHVTYKNGNDRIVVFSCNFTHPTCSRIVPGQEYSVLLATKVEYPVPLSQHFVLNNIRNGNGWQETPRVFIGIDKDRCPNCYIWATGGM